VIVPPLKSGKGKAVIVALLPLAASFVSWAYEIGYFAYFGLPFDYVEASGQRIFLITTLLVLPIAALVYLFPPIKDRWWNHWILAADYPIWASIPVVICILGLLWIATGVWFYWQPNGVGMLSAAWVYLVLTLCVLLVGLSDALARYNNAALEMQRDDGRLGDQPRDTYRAAVKRLSGHGIGLIAFLPLFSAATGLWAASLQTDYWYVEHAPDYLLVRKSGEVLIFMKFNNQGLFSPWEPEISLMRIKNDDPLRLRKREIRPSVITGPLL
jgi:hypothetical protein